MMFTISTIIATGPGLMMAMSALALFIVYHSLSPVRHALIWSAAFAVSAFRWSYVALSGLMGGPEMVGGLMFDLLGIVSILLFAEGFRVRSGRRGLAWITPVIGAAAIGATLTLFALPPMPLRAALVPLTSILLLAWCGRMVTPPGNRRSAAEIAVIAMLIGLAVIHLTGTALAVAEQFGWIASHNTYNAFYAAVLDPASAATGMFALLLIAFDFSAELRRLIHTDPLTGVLNRLGFELAAAAEIKRSRNRSLSLPIADIDGFKGINDRNGHVAGDAILVDFARHLAGAMDGNEAVGRIGGEEFALLLPGSDGPAALDRIEAVRRGLAGMTAGDMTAVTASFGVAEWQARESLSGLTERADKALYRSKREGRDRSTLAEQPAQ